MENAMKTSIEIDGYKIGAYEPVYFIADIGANHDGDIERAKDLIWKASEAGAHAAKFQHFSADTIVSDYGFKSLGSQMSHQSKWNKSVYDIYDDASLETSWTTTLKATCDDAGITFFTSPYSKSLVDHVDPYVPAYKIGSGDITWLGIIDHILSKGKPVLLATGASNFVDVEQAMQVIFAKTKNVVLMQCNTNYTANIENFKFVNLNVLKEFRKQFPEVILGLSDHTPGHTTVLGAVTLGARVVEKHFTDSCEREGPDHKFAMDPRAWRQMVEATRELEYALGDGVKRVEENELETSVLQRRCLRATKTLRKGDKIGVGDFLPLRPCVENAIRPSDELNVVGMQLTKALVKGQELKWEDVKTAS